MPDRSFEQQVREELSDLRMQPDVASWEVVTASLQRERKRRWVLWLLLLAICCGGGWMWRELQTKKVHQPVTVNRPYAATHDQQLNREGVVSNRSVGKKETVQETAYQQKQTANLAIVTGEPGKMDMPGKREASKPVPEGMHTKAAETAVATIEKNQELTATVLPETTIDSSQERKPAVTTAPVTAVKEKVILNGKKKWRLHLFVNAGSSGVRNSILRTHAASADMSYSQPSSGGITNGLGTPVSPLLHDAFSFNLGIEFNKAIGRKNQIGIAVSYGLYQDRLHIGMRRDSTIKSAQNGRYSNTGGYYYKNTDSMTYTNRYHFLEAAVHFYTPFRLFRVLPFRWDLGAGAGILLGSNGLHYDQKDNLLFHNNDLLRKLNWQLSTGLDLGIGKRPFLYVGPQVKFFLSNLSQQQGTMQYLLQPSMRAVYILPQQKH